MASCVLYARVSSDRQSGNTSIPDQLELLRAWAARNGCLVAAEFVDDGESARVGTELTESFERRPGWRKLRAYLREHPAKHGGPVLVVFKDYKRFSRDVAAAHATIRELRTAGVTVQAAEQPIDWSVPEQKLLVGLYLADGEVDNDRRSAAVRRGMAARAREGRHTLKPPLGYRATYNGRQRTGIELDPNTAPVVLAAFERAANPDVPLVEIRRALNLDLRRPALTSDTSIKNLLTNRTYTGQISVPLATREELGEWVPGQHEPLVSESLWRDVQDRLDGRHRRYTRRKAVHPELYLRGMVREAHTGTVMTGSGVRARQGHRVWYYHTQGRGATRVSAEKVHDSVLEWLRSHTPTPAMVELLRACIWEEFERMNEDAVESRRRAERDAEAAVKRLERATEALVDGLIEPDAYAPLAARLRAERDAAFNVLSAPPPQATVRVLENALQMAADTAGIYEAAGPEERREVVGSIMPAGLAAFSSGVIEPLPDPLLTLLFGLNDPEKAETQNGRPGADGHSPVGWALLDSNQ